MKPKPQVGSGSDESGSLTGGDSYRRFFDDAVDGLFRTSPSGRLLLANQALAKLAGYDSPGEMIASVTDLAEQFYVNADDRGRFRTALETAGVVRNFETQMRQRDGTIVWISADARALRDEHGNVCFEGMLRENTAQKTAETALYQERNRLQQILDSLFGFVAVLSLTGEVVEINQAPLTLAGLTRTDVLGRRFWDIGWLEPRDQMPTQAAVAAAARGETVRRDVVARFPALGVREIDATFSPLRDAAGTVINLIAFGVDITERKRAEASTAYLGEIVQSSDDAIIGNDLAGIIASWNPGAEKTFGYTAAEAIGQPILILVPPERVEEEADILARISRGERLHHHEIIRVRKDGRCVHVSTTISPIQDATGIIIGVSRIARDITLQKQQEHELQRLTRLYAALSQINQAIVMTPERAALYTKVCKALVEFGGFKMAWIGRVERTTLKVIPVGKWGDEFGYLSKIEVSVDDRPQGHGPTGTVIREGRSYICNDSMHDPRTLPWREQAARSGFRSSATFPVREGDEICAALCVYSDEVGFFQDKEVALLEEAAGDVSFALDNLAREEARRRSDEALRASEDRFRVLVENIREVFWLSELDTRKILYISPAFLAIWGRTPESLYDSNPSWIETVHESDRARVLRAAQMQQRAGTYDETYRVVRPDGTIRWVRARAFPVPAPHGTVTRIVGVAEDVTHERDLETKLLRTQRLEAIGTLSSGIAHDLNNILAPILMATGLLRNEIRTPHNRELIELIENGAQRGANIIRQLLTFSRGIEGERAAVQPRHILNEMAAIARETFPRNIAVALDVARDMSLVSADATQLHQVVMNLCVNARDAMAEGGTLKFCGRNVELRAAALPAHPDAKPGRYVCIAIADTGHGIPASMIDRIFEPFFTTKGVGKGTGLGLSTVLGIVKSHGGFVTVDSAPGRGATFSVYLPALADSTASFQPEADQRPPRGSGELVLVVDDERSIREVTSAGLRQWNYRAQTAADGEEGLALFLKHRAEVKLVLIDLMMPVMGGSTLIRKLWEHEPTLKIIAMSGMVPDDQRAELAALKVHEPLVKPFPIEELLARVAHVLSEPPSSS